MILGKSGYPSTRNLDRAFRPIRLDKKGRPDKLDSMGSTAHRVMNSTGSFGVPGSTNIRVKQFGPRKGRRKDKKPKRGCHLLSTSQLGTMVEGTTRKHKVFGCAAAFPKIALNGEAQQKPMIKATQQKTRVPAVVVFKPEPPKMNCVRG